VSRPFEEFLGLTVAMTVRELLPRGAHLVPTAKAGESNAQTILLPSRETSERLAVGDTLGAFVYLDSEDRPVATTRQPALELGQVTFLTVTDLTAYGAFVDWQLPKDLLVPFAEQTCDPRMSEAYPIGLMRDTTGRLCGTMRIAEMLRVKPRYQLDAWVEGEAWRREPGLGVFVIVEKSCVGLLPESEPHRLQRGQKERFRIASVLSDGKIELSLRRRAFEEIEDDATKVLEVLTRPNRAPFGDHSSPEEIRATFGLSKKAFKRAVGRLLRQGVVAVDEAGCVVVR
jgi:uncharacterized protein